MSQFNIYKGGISVKKPSGVTEIAAVIDRIRNDAQLGDQVAEVRAQDNDKAAGFFKRKLDYVTFSGIFSPVRLASNLVTHSGLIVLDFDHLADAGMLRLQFQTDPYVMACFLSPGGKGLKVIVKIKETEKHKETFADLAHYFNTVYLLPDAEKVDISGSDVSRPCFLSHDPEAYYNPKAKTYAIKNLIPAKPRTEQQLQQDATDTERHIAAVVQRVVDSRMDVCNDYGQEWLLIAFCMATLGENGRQYFHQISEQNAKYEAKDADEKFDNALKTTRFTNPAKFFSICKDYGLDVSKPKAEKKEKPVAEPEKTEKEAKKGKKDVYRFQENTVFYTPEGGMEIKSGKYFDEVASNFQVFIKYRTEDEQENVTWVLEIRKSDGTSEFIEVLHDDFCSARKLKNMLATRRLGFKIKDGHLDELMSYLFTKTQFNSASKVLRYGFHADSKVYFFANKALNLVNGQMLEPDEFGIVEANKMHLSIPKNQKVLQQRYTLTDNDVTFAKFWRLYATAHFRENAFLPTCFYVFSLFRDLGLQYKNFSPILFLKGGAGTGKSSLARTLTAAFGRKQQGVNLKSKNTDAALIKLMSQTSNAIIWFDEFHNELPNEGLLQAAYDNDGYHKSTADFNSIDTASVDIYSALALTSNYLPDNPIFFSRCVFVPITAQNKTDAQRKAFYELEDIQETGMGCLSVELLRHREILEKGENYLISYNLLYNSLKTNFKGQDVPERLFANMAQIMAAPYTLNVCGKINLLDFESDDQAEILTEYVEMGAVFINRQWRIMNDSKAIAEFFEIVQMLFDSYHIHEAIHFRFKGQMIMINFRKLYNLFAQKYRQMHFKSPPDRDTIQSEIAQMAGKSDWEELAKSIRFDNDGEGKSEATTIPQTGSCELEYKQLEQNFGLNLRDRNEKN